MGDVTLYQEPVSQAIDEMRQATTTMQNALEAFIQDVNQILSLAPNEEGIAGLTSQSWQQIQNQLNAKIDDMNALFGQGAPTLQYMTDQIHQGDNQGANIIGSGTG